MTRLSPGHYRNAYIKDPKRCLLIYFLTFFQHSWPLAGPDIARKGGQLLKMTRRDRQTHFGTFDFWVKPILELLILEIHVFGA